MWAWVFRIRILDLGPGILRSVPRSLIKLELLGICIVFEGLEVQGF